MRRKCIIWGMGKGYEEILNQIKFEIYKDNMEVIAVVCRPEDKYCRYRDGFPIISKEEMKGLGFEYVIVSSYLFYQEIREEAMKWGIDANKILNGQIFKIPLFDFIVNDKNKFILILCAIYVILPLGGIAYEHSQVQYKS